MRWRPTHSIRTRLENTCKLERAADCKIEYYAGEIDAMAGGTAIHSRLSARAVVVLDRHLSGCQIYESNLKSKSDS